MRGGFTGKIRYFFNKETDKTHQIPSPQKTFGWRTIRHSQRTSLPIFSRINAVSATKETRPAASSRRTGGATANCYCLLRR
jgi:hypothetical protein